ncbi:succinyl-diaminopimelate desuccinylase [Corynebacterium sp. ES2794-CONJ1]|uniref:succinyl-diaminopimelate desuccinylase n=1 Tax=unclassified Corynebacterium TaxID=2624378 RepID=UPI002167E732|nr:MULTISPECIES: succinyl-diaminopimelate desuccinylase [unclassified Corynebacterium]MCS4489882.1 succinyl-diaminopimelate desuccinylase [Corynebacterium sp. ES2775-CONJ]MCS4491754.1 succinyl-diaminopimelate desuccinylase [Corynebacterium sp. ES2715-CONJ3]MCS4531859.1 succinyl-diaminopimelate desuccinylase [Corynebacterium sp. ES2730-CONJ]MCU9519256.1 succinyl-diaminopimelate desuccinylase [Corynebacterium sp. ES2794-CONJ1]
MIDLSMDPVELTEALMNIPSPSHHEEALADELEGSLRKLPDVEVLRLGNSLVARTNRGLPARVILAGHIDTVPPAENLPARRGLDSRGRDTLFGLGSVDMKSGLAVYAHTFATLSQSPDLKYDLTLVCYEAEEVAERYNGLKFIAEQHPEWLRGDLALLGEPSEAIIEAGCQGSIRLKVSARGVRAHSARSWLGLNAMHLLAPVIANIAAYKASEVDVDGCYYHEGLNIVHCESGVATNTIPDEAWLYVNYRFAPHRDLDAAMAHLLEVLDLPDSVDYEIDDAVPGARPGLDQHVVQDLIAATGQEPRAKFGWTDVARFSELGIPAVNFGSGDPSFCHKKDEQCPVEMITELAEVLRRYLVA